MDINGVIMEIMGGSSFMLWASVDLSDEGFTKIFSILANSDIIKKQVENLHFYEIKGIADKSEDTIHITGDVFIGNKRVFEAYVSISSISKDPNVFCDILEKSQNVCIDYLNVNYKSFLSTNHLTDINFSFDDLLVTHMFVSDMSRDANEAAYRGLDISDKSVDVNNIITHEYKINDTSPGNDSTDAVLLKMLNTILDFLNIRIGRGEMFIIEIKYTTKTSLGDEFEAVTVLDSVSAFNNTIGMFGAFSYYSDNTIIVEPKMKSYVEDTDNLGYTYVNDLVVDNVYSTIVFIHKVTSNPVDITLKMDIKDNNEQEEDFWKYV